MLNILLCDDDRRMIEHYSAMITEAAKKHKIEVTLSAFESAESLLFYLTETPDLADIIYLDILMGKQNGMEAAKELRSYGCDAEIIFLTTSEDYVFEAFSVTPVQYLLKETTSQSTFEQTFLRAAELVKRKEKESLLCEYGSNRKLIPFKSISFFDIWRRIITVHYNTDQTAKFYSSMENLEQQLVNKNFVRVHRSFLVNLAFIEQFQSQNLILKTGAAIPIGAKYMQSLKDVFTEYISNFRIYDISCLPSTGKDT